MYRDAIEGLQQRLRELDRALEAKRREVPAFRAAGPGPPAAPPTSATRYVAPVALLAVLLIIVSIAAKSAHDQLASSRAHQARVEALVTRYQAPPVKRRTWHPRLSASSRPGVQAGDVCIVSVEASCFAEVWCGGQRLYVGSGQCDDDGFVDRAASALDGTPQMQIDGQRFLLRELTPQLRTEWKLEGRP